MELKDIRNEIDSIDNEIIELYKKRMSCSQAVAKYKLENGIEIFNSEREKQILDSVEQKAGVYGKSARLLYFSIMELSRALQHDVLGSGTELKNRINSAQKTIPFDDPDIRIACFGAEGAYSHKAARRIFPGHQPVFYSPFKEVFEAVLNGQADFGVIPIENSSAGSVTAVYDLMLKYRFSIAAAADIKVDHCLAAKPGTDITAIKTVYSHDQALLQCSDFIGANKNISFKPFVSTAQAAKFVSESGDNDIAAICSEDAAEKYGLEILRRGFQNNPENTTRFIVITKTMYIEPDADKISLSFALPHVTGSLYGTLCRFAFHGLNLTKIESRPVPGKQFEYVFYLDFAGSVSQPDILQLMGALSEELVDFTFLGNYKEFSC